MVSALLSGQTGKVTLETTGDAAQGLRLNHVYGRDVIKGYNGEDFPYCYVGDANRILSGHRRLQGP